MIVCDELAFYLNTTDRTANKEAGNLMRDLVSRGRAAGVIFLAATQKPSGDTIPTYLRDLFAFRWAFRCTTPQMSDTILGAGWSTAGYTATSIDAAHRGVGYLLHEGGEPVRMRTFYLTDDDLTQLARRAEQLRRPPAKAVQLPPRSTATRSRGGRRMILVILAGILGLWLAGNHHPAGWGLAAAAHLLWLPYALAPAKPGFALAVAAFGRLPPDPCCRPPRELPQRPALCRPPCT